jgi:FkbM family methyltransferase
MNESSMNRHGEVKEALSAQPCAFSDKVGRLRDCFTHFLIPFVRTYVRYTPWTMGKQSFWARIVDPYFAWHAHHFLVPTIFGSYIAGDARDIIQQYIYYFGIWEPNLTHWMAERLTPGDTFIDVGANVGYYSLLASKLVGTYGTVVAIEASPEIFKTLQRNLALNYTENVRPVNMAVYHSNAVLKVFRGSEYEVGQTTILEDEAVERGFEVECEVDAAPLSAILRREEMQNARLIKIDVEGAEWSVVHGMRPLLDSSRSDLEIIIEIKPECLARRGKQPDDLLNILSDAGFCAYRLENDYSVLSYLVPNGGRRPTRIRDGIECSTDVIFSRHDSEHL